MADEQSTSVSSEVSTANSEVTGVETQSTAQVDTTQSKPNSLDAKTTPDVSVSKPAPKVEAQAEPAGKLNYNEMISKYVEGTLSDEDTTAIEKAGLSTDQFKLMGEAQKAIMLKNNDILYTAVGGKDSYENLKSFAAEHLSEEEISGYNSALNSGNMRLAEMAVLGLKALHDKQNGTKAARRLTGDGFEQASIVPYESQQELIKDLNSRQYRMDSEFKQKVDARRNKSGF